MPVLKVKTGQGGMPLGSDRGGSLRVSHIIRRGVLLMVPMKYKGLGFERYDSDA